MSREEGEARVQGSEIEAVRRKGDESGEAVKCDEMRGCVGCDGEAERVRGRLNEVIQP